MNTKNLETNKNSSLFMQAIDENYAIGYNYSNQYNTEEFNKDNLKDLENFIDKVLYDDKVDAETAYTDLSPKRFTSFNEFNRNRKISDLFANSWMDNLKLLKEKTMINMPYHSAQVKLKSRVSFEKIPHLNLEN